MEDTLKELRALEERLLEFGVRRSKEELDLLIADDFVEFGSSGRSFDKEAIVRALGEEQAPLPCSIRDFRVNLLSATVGLATYVLVDSRDTAGQRHSLRSSVWVRRRDRWQIVFHQGTRGTDVLLPVDDTGDTAT
jgi:hypothetical protein